MQKLVMRVYVLLDFFMKQQTTLKTGQVPVLALLSTGVTVCLAVLLSAGLGTRSPPAYICGTSSRQPDARWPPDLLPLTDIANSICNLQFPYAVIQARTSHTYSLRETSTCC